MPPPSDDPMAPAASIRLTALGALMIATCAIGCTHPVEAPPKERCLPGEHATGSPGSIAEAIELINSLPMPVTAKCFAESLDRPLRIEATNSISSAQPAAGARSPRIFIFKKALILSIVPDGPGAELLEFGELVGRNNRSIKGEIEFPVEAPLPESAPYEHLLINGAPVTFCALCHADEQPVDGIGGAFESVAMRPTLRSIVPVERILDEAAECDPEEEPERCAYLEAIVGHGPIEHQPFPDALPTFF
ncbi:MAG: hypothetical protein AAGF12_10685 [Myxococcota bacterium]